MKCLVEGHLYELESFEKSEDPASQVIQFIHKERSEDGSKFITVKNGTTNEEVIAVLIDRLSCLNAKAPCAENVSAISHLKKCLMYLNQRTKDRERRNVEGTPAK